jgi:hypothetical protein
VQNYYKIKFSRYLYSDFWAKYKPKPDKFSGAANIKCELKKVPFKMSKKRNNTFYRESVKDSEIPTKTLTFIEAYKKVA